MITYNNIDDAYADLVRDVLENGIRKENRTGVDTLSRFAYSYRVDISESFPLLRTKYINFDQIVAENAWFLSGEKDITLLRDEFGYKFWNAWANEAGEVDTAYGRFWRHFPLPHIGQPEWDDTDPTDGVLHHWGETWTLPPYGDDYTGANSYVHHTELGLAFDQIAWISDELTRNPNSRRLVLTAWHPANATVSKLPPCFVSGSMVATDSGHIPIENVKAGDKVLTKDGTYKSVLQTWETPYEGQLIDIGVWYRSDKKPIRATPNHPFYVKDLGWVPAGELREGDLLAVPRSKVYNENYSFDYVSRTVNGKEKKASYQLTDHDYYVLGYMVGNGWASETSNRIGVSIPNEKVDVILPKIRETIKVSSPDKSANVTSYHTRNRKWRDFFVDNFGTGAHNKKIPSWLIESSDIAIRKFLIGYLDADGDLKTNPDRPGYTTTSESLANGLQLLQAKIGEFSNVLFQERTDTTIIEERTVNQKNTWQGHFISRPQRTTLDSDFIYVPIKKISRSAMNGHVYNMSVMDNPTYTVDNILNHNCHYTFCFNVQGDRLNGHLTQRSADIALGVPFNIAGYSLLIYLFAKECGLKPGEFSHTLVDAHIYENHIDGLREQISRDVSTNRVPQLLLAPDVGLDNLTPGKARVIYYDYEPAIKFEVAV